MNFNQFVTALIVVFAAITLVSADSDIIYRFSSHTSLASAKEIMQAVYDGGICPPFEQVVWVYDPLKRVAFHVGGDKRVSNSCMIEFRNSGITRNTMETSVDPSCYVQCGHPTCVCPRGEVCTASTEEDVSPCAPGNECLDGICTHTAPIPVQIFNVRFSRGPLFRYSAEELLFYIDKYYLARIQYLFDELALHNCESEYSHVTQEYAENVTFHMTLPDGCTADLDAVIAKVNERDPHPYVPFHEGDTIVPPELRVEVIEPITIIRIDYSVLIEEYPASCYAPDDTLRCFSADHPECVLKCPLDAPCEPKYGKTACTKYQGCVPKFTALQPDGRYVCRGYFTNSVTAHALSVVSLVSLLVVTVLAMGLHF